VKLNPAALAVLDASATAASNGGSTPMTPPRSLNRGTLASIMFQLSIISFEATTSSLGACGIPSMWQRKGGGHAGSAVTPGARLGRT